MTQVTVGQCLAIGETLTNDGDCACCAERHKLARVCRSYRSPKTGKACLHQLGHAIDATRRDRKITVPAGIAVTTEDA